jgi:signal transduction histidine kinase/CheY-like chemotaxis protein
MTAALLIGAMALFSYFVVENEAKTISLELRKQAIALADNLAASTASYIIVEDYTTLESILKRAAMFPSIIEVQVIDHQNKMLGDVFRNTQGEIETRFGNLISPPPGNPERHINLFDNLMIVWQPVVLGDLVGWVRIIYTLDRVSEVRAQIWRFNATVGSSVVFFTLLLLFLYLRRPVHAIERSAAFANELDSHAGQQIEVDDSYHEIRTLTSALNRTSRSLQSKNDALKQKILEQEQLTDSLEQMVLERTEELSIARDEAVRANQSKSEFLANMSHEIRTPLTAIIGFSESLLDSSQNIDERVDAIRRITRAGKHLLRVINEILDLSKIEANRLEVEILPVKMVDIFSDVYSLAKLQADEKGLAFKIDCEYPVPDTIRTDPVRFKQILINLCNNAIKFTNEGSVHLKVTCDRDNEILNVKVIDTGIGLTKDQTSKLFKPFSQADTSTTRKYGGTGLGLHLSRQLAKKLGGDLTVESVQDVGSSFMLTVKTGDLSNVALIQECPDFDSYADGQESLYARPPLHGCVLLTEDNLDNQRLVTLYLQRLGLDVVIANNGQEALKKVQLNQPDLILMDVQMPVMDGLTATRKLRHQGYNGPIIALTASVMQDEQQRCLDAGCNDICTKPIEHGHFVEVLSAYLQPGKLPTPARNISPIKSTLLEEEPDLADLVRGFVSKLPQQLEEIDRLFKQRDMAEFKIKVHTLKGTAGNFGYRDMFEVAKKIEFEIVTENYVAIQELLDSLSALLVRMQACFNGEQPVTDNIRPIRK